MNLLSEKKRIFPHRLPFGSDWPEALPSNSLVTQGGQKTAHLSLASRCCCPAFSGRLLKALEAEKSRKGGTGVIV